MADLEPGEGVVLDNICDSIHGRGIGDSPNHGSNANIGYDNCVSLSFREENRVG